MTLESEAGHFRRRKISDLHQLWHLGVQDRLPRSVGGVTWHSEGRAVDGRGQAHRHYLGLYENREAAQCAVPEFREQHPTTRLRKLDSVRRNHVRCYDEDTLFAQRAPIIDVIESGVK